MIPRALFVRLSTIVSRIPSICNFGLMLRFTFETECSRRFKPFVDRKLGCEGMITLSAAAKCIDCHHPQRRHTVDENVVVILSHAVDSIFQNVLATHNIEQSSFHAGEFDVGRENIHALAVM